MKKSLVMVAVIALLTVAGVQAQKGVRTHSEELVDSQACCSSFGNFNFTGVLSMSRDSGGTACFNCVPNVPNSDIGIKFPEGVFGQGQAFSATMTFHSQIPGPCLAGFLLFNLALNTAIAGNSLNIANCGANTLRLVEFFGNTVPPTPQVAGDNFLVGIIQASDGTTRTDFEQIVIQ